MKITICNKSFDTDQINDIIITPNNVLIDANDDFYKLKYSNESEIDEAKTYLKFKSLRKTDLIEAVMILITTCDYFINSKSQCELCPLKRKKGCIFHSNPIDWRY